MKVNMVTYQKLFQTGIYQNHRIGVEVQVDAGEDATAVFSQAKELVEQFHKLSAPVPGEADVVFNNEVREDMTPEETKEELKSRVMLAKDITELKSWRIPVFSSSSSPEIQTIYEDKLRDFLKG